MIVDLKFERDMTEELRLNTLKSEYTSYYKNYLLLLTLGLIWLIAAWLGSLDLQVSIFSLFFGITLFKPALFLMGKLLRTPKIHKDESLKLLTRLIMIGILIGMLAGFFPFTENINLFFPAFTIIFGIIFGFIAITTRLKLYGFLAIAMISGGLYLGYTYPENFSISGYFSGAMMTGLGILNGIVGKKIRISFFVLRKKLKRNISSIKKKTQESLKKPMRPQLLKNDNVITKDRAPSNEKIF